MILLFESMSYDIFNFSLGILLSTNDSLVSNKLFSYSFEYQIAYSAFRQSDIPSSTRLFVDIPIIECLFLF